MFAISLQLLNCTLRASRISSDAAGGPAQGLVQPMAQARASALLLLEQPKLRKVDCHVKTPTSGDPSCLIW